MVNTIYISIYRERRTDIYIYIYIYIHIYIYIFFLLTMSILIHSLLKSCYILYVSVLLINQLNMLLFLQIFHDISGYTVACRYLKKLQISSAEMTEYMCNIKIAGTNCLTKKYRVHIFANVRADKMVAKYITRPERFESLTLIQYAKVL